LIPIDTKIFVCLGLVKTAINGSKKIAWNYFIAPSATQVLKISSIVDRYKTDVGFSAPMTRRFSVQVEFIILFINWFLYEYDFPTVELLTCPCP